MTFTDLRGAYMMGDGSIHPLGKAERIDVRDGVFTVWWPEREADRSGDIVAVAAMSGPFRTAVMVEDGPLRVSRGQSVTIVLPIAFEGIHDKRAEVARLFDALADDVGLIA